ncbi:hypothetical protein [Achromobacter phage Motura]|uniref:Uncharacterized protein n=1 Tax=Achromobacter phage Motura TaxID=2591403 RepID=A0A514CSZ9_9CAUD|nr:hypothetical protein H1O15_gp180 [Achromobacter phage Motura]QDH83608.1 hypothetical protein [Achromobacter phage Motura]
MACYDQIIENFLEHNPEPSDEQVHAFAHALGVDKEELESDFYRMLSERLGYDVQASPPSLYQGTTYQPQNYKTEPFRVNSSARLHALTLDQRINDGDYDPETTPAVKNTINDGETSPSKNYEMQNVLYDDGGETEDDLGDVLYNDGEPNVFLD